MKAGTSAMPHWRVPKWGEPAEGPHPLSGPGHYRGCRSVGFDGGLTPGSVTGNRDESMAPGHASAVIDATRIWAAYISAITRHIEGSTRGIPNVDRIIKALIYENLKRVEAELRKRDAVVTKIELASKAKSGELWRKFDEWMKAEARRRQPLYNPFGLPQKAEKAAFARYPVESYLQHDGRYAHTQNADVHHIWPETLGGPSEGWNLVPLPPHTHHDVLHPIIDPIVRESEPGEQFLLLASS